MELRHLRYFQAVAEELSFSRAARRLRIAQPALSRAVQEMERELDTQLIERERRSPRLTPAGAVLLHETGLILDRLEESLRRVRRTAKGEEGELRLGYIGPPTRTFLARLLKEYGKRFPRVTVILEERTPERVWEMVSKGRLSVGLTRPVLAHEVLGLQTLLLREEKFCAAVPKDHAWAKLPSLSWRKLAGAPLIILARREGAGSHDAIHAACEAAGVVPRVKHTPSLIGTIMQYVESGAGIGIVPESTASKNLVLIPLKPQQTIPLVMVWAKEGDDPAVVAFRDLVKEWLREGKLWEV
ncbi:LysR substrate-binding domain-containing protein [Prosthecobacter sp.]|uniref:LysR family transcriptional regulator n=1 Tax=Prosthecobacter sp. TaxID=1965333 RepID=UPI002489EB7E|nr:LysR substrate-binding domain-containing protein [Prosthecobacter sp.]MDI1314077.1 LysR substrate-binding domain-containing protein [Prosthecobacter sp.]